MRDLLIFLISTLQIAFAVVVGLAVFGKSFTIPAALWLTWGVLCIAKFFLRERRGWLEWSAAVAGAGDRKSVV